MHFNLILLRRHNQRSIELTHDTTGEDVGVLKSDGEYKYYRWLGFISRAEAKKQPGAVPVKLEISCIRNTDLPGLKWENLPEGSHVQGCKVAAGVYAVVDTTVRIV